MKARDMGIGGGCRGCKGLFIDVSGVKNSYGKGVKWLCQWRCMGVSDSGERARERKRSRERLKIRRREVAHVKEDEKSYL